jgi:predicted ATP-grasp superfamily ATP-dependent carboligase
MERFLIASASGRALAQSARKAGYSVDVFDHFGDWDLQQSVNESAGSVPINGSVFSSRDFNDLFRLVDLSTYRAAIIGGGLESKIELVNRLEQCIPILGCHSYQLERLASFACLEVIPELVENSGARWPVTRTSVPNESRTFLWLMKDLRGSGGSHVRRWQAKGLGNERSIARENLVYQQCIDGMSISALFVRRGRLHNGDPIPGSSNEQAISDCQLVGCSQQLVGEPSFGALPYAYCGSIAPLVIPEGQRKIIERLGASISAEFEIDGVFGIDLIVNKEGVWLIDINPRIPASAELYELLASEDRQDSFSVFKAHLQACYQQNGTIRPATPVDGRWVAKGILFCKIETGMIVTEAVFGQLKQLSYEDLSSTHRKIADVPMIGTSIAKGEPILSLFVQAESIQGAHRLLLLFAEQLNGLLTNRYSQKKD